MAKWAKKEAELGISQSLSTDLLVKPLLDGTLLDQIWYKGPVISPNFPLELFEGQSAACDSAFTSSMSHT